MSRRILQIGITAILVVLGILVAARSAEPSVRPVLWPPRTTVVEVRNAALPDPVETTTSSTSTTTSTTTSEPPATTTTSTTTSEPPTTTTTEPPPDEPVVDELAVLAGQYGWLEQGDRVRDLQALLGLSADGVYGGATRAAHLAEVQERGLAADGIPSVPTTTTTTTTTTEVPIDEEAVLLSSYGWNERGAGVRVLQRVLGVSADGHYGPTTRAAHLAEVQERGLAADGIPPVPTTTVAPTTTVVPTTTVAPTTTVPSTTVPETPVDGSTDTTTTTVAATTTTVAPTTTTAPSVFGGMGAEIVAQLLGQPCIADGVLSDCPPNVVDLVSGLTGGS